MKKRIVEASKTLISMCIDYQTGVLTEETFVNNLQTFAKGTKEEFEKGTENKNG